MSRKPAGWVLAAWLALTVGAGMVHAQGRRGGGGMVGGRGGGAGGFHGSPSFGGGGGARPGMGGGGGGVARPGMGGGGGGGGARPSPQPGGGGGNRPGMGGGGEGHRPGSGGAGEHPPFGGIGGNRPGAGAGAPGNRPGNGNGPARPPQPGIGGDRPGGGGFVGQRPNGGANRPGMGDNLGVVNRPNSGNHFNRPNNSGNTVNRPNVGNNVNRPINSGNTDANINRPVNSGNNVVNRPINNSGNTNVVNRPTNINNVTNNTVTSVNNFGRGGYGYGGAGYRGPGYGGYGYGGYRGNPYSGYHAGWVNGYWNGNYARGWGGGGWGWNAMGLGMGIGVASWGLGSLWNSWGYSSYANPYYMPTTTVVQPVVYNYAQPLDLSSPSPSQSVVEQSVSSLDAARAAFRSGDYPGALARVDEAIRQTPNDPILHQFRATSLFAMGRYDEAAPPLYAVLSAGPGWDWTTLAGLYPSVDVYTQQLRDLEAYCNAHPKAASARFVLASLYMTQGSNDAAAGILKQVVAIQPQDKLSSQLLAALTPAVATTTTSTDPPPTEQPPPATAAATEGPGLPAGPVPAKLAGTWTASPAKDVTIALALDGERGFTWKVTDRGQARQFRGAATFDKETLALSPPDQPPMVGSVAWKDDAHFQFKALGAPTDDPGLTFGR